MSSEPLAEAVEGVTKAALDWSLEKLSSFVKKLKERKLAFIVDAHSPSIFVVTGFKSAAKIVETTIPLLQNIMQNYDLERFSGDEKEILFFKRKQV